MRKQHARDKANRLQLFPLPRPTSTILALRLMDLARAWSEEALRKCASFARQEFLNCCLEWCFAVTIVLPWPASCQKGASGFHCEALGVKAGAHLAPVKRHRDRRVRSHARGERRHCRRHAIVAQVIEEDLSGTQASSTCLADSGPAILDHGRAHGLRKGLGLDPSQARPFL